MSAAVRTPAQTPDVRTLTVAGLAQLVSWLALQLVPTLAGPVLVGMTATPALAGVPLGTAFLATAAAAAVADRLASRVGGAGILRRGALFGAAGTALAALASVTGSAPVLVAGVGLAGFGIGWCWLTRYAAARAVGPEHWRLALGFVVGLAAVGAVGGPLTIPLLEGVSRRAGLAPGTLAWLLASALFLLLAGMSGWLAADRADPTHIEANPASLQDLAPTLLLFGVVQGAMTTAMALASAVWFRGAAPSLALAAVMSVHFFGMFGLAPALAVRLEPAATPRSLRIACLAMAASLLGLIAARQPLVQALAMFGVGLAWSLGYVALSLQLAVLPPALRPRLQARGDLVGQLVGGLAPLAAGPVLAAVGFGWLLAGMAGLSLAALPATARFGVGRALRPAPQPAGALPGVAYNGQAESPPPHR